MTEGCEGGGGLVGSVRVWGKGGGGGGRTFVGIVGGHEKGGVDFQTPAAALDGARGGHFGEVSIVIIVSHIRIYDLAPLDDGDAVM